MREFLLRFRGFCPYGRSLIDLMTMKDLQAESVLSEDDDPSHDCPDHGGHGCPPANDGHSLGDDSHGHGSRNNSPRSCRSIT